VVLASLPLCRGPRAAIPVLLVSAGVYAADAGGVPLPVSHALMSLGLAIVLLAPVVRAAVRPA